VTVLFYTLLFIACFLAAWLLRRCRFVLYSLSENSIALLDAMIGRYDDEDQKIDLIQKKTNALSISLLKLIGVIFGVALTASMPILLYCQISSIHCTDLDWLALPPLLVISGASTLAFVIPLSRKDTLGYSELSRLLHRMALNHYNLSIKLLRLETKRIQKKNLTPKTRFLIISGLARSGTTSLMNCMAELPAFAALSYANMPFLMCPNLWKKVYRPASNEQKERSHKDGIQIGLTSHEALEEYFFKVSANDSYIHANHLSEYALSESAYRDYVNYQTIIKHDDESLYLAKNNNFILRYESVRSFNDDFVMAILFRDPLTHAASLLEKHRDYTKLQSDDPFVLEYMNWLGHHEFGQNHKPFLFAASSDIPTGDKNGMDYWLTCWIHYYNKALSMHHPNTLLIHYDDFCREPANVIHQLLHKLDEDTAVENPAAFHNARATTEPYSETLYQQAQQLYIQLLSSAEAGDNT
jgi:hypothetical protein